jgi:ABC-2 type transport system permease protein
VIGLQINVAGLSWFRDNPALPIAVLVGSWIWITTISLVALAISAWVKYKPIATASLLGVFFALAAFGQAANNILNLRPRWGDLLSLPTTMNMIWTWLLSPAADYQRMIARSARTGVIPISAAFITMLVLSLVSLVLLIKKIRAAEVIRG